MQPTNRAAWLRVWIFASCLLAGCDGPGKQIVLEPLGERRDASADEDAGVELPEGAIPCEQNSDCDDGVDCTVDQCLSQGYCSVRLDNSRCSDGIICNGTEACDPTQGGCVPGVIPTCDDQDPCTIDRCDEAAKDCIHDPRDFDRDGEADYHCAGGSDCDDFDARRGANAREICSDGVDNDCDEVADESDCGAIEHDTCDDALDVSAGGSFEQPLAGALGDYSTGCDLATESLHDLVYTFELDEPADVKIVAHGWPPDGSNEEISNVAIEGECGSTASEVRCARGVPADLRVRDLPAGRYYVVASSINSVQKMELDVSYGPPTSPQPNPTCDTATPIGPPGGHFAGDFVQVGDDIINACTNPGQPDVFYSIHLDQESDIEITAFGEEPPHEIYVTLRNGCEEGQEAAGQCDMGARVSKRYYQQPPGDYILVLESRSTPEQGYELDVAITQPTPPPHGDSCRDPLTIAVGETQRVELTNLKDDALSSCQSSGPDAVFALMVPSPQDIQVEADADGAIASVALQITCGDSRSERQCRTGQPLNTRIHNIGAGSYFLTVNAAEGAQAVTVKVTGLALTPLTNITGNDTCYSAADIPPEGGLFGGDTQLLLADYSTASCGGGAASKDAAFRLVLTGRKRVNASVDAEFDAVLMRYATPDGSSMLCDDPIPAACSDDVGSGTTEVLEELLDPGTYYYIVDGFKDFNAGSYLFEVAVTDP